MDLRHALICIVLVFLAEHAKSMRHLVYWDGKLIPELQKEGLRVTVEIDDWMDVLCPYYGQPDTRSTMIDSDSLLLYNVTKYAFHSCDIRGGRQVQVCDDPSVERKLTTKFQKRSPSPFGFTFRPGESYYYISKPIGDNTSKGCTEKTLRMIVNVKEMGTVFNPRDRTTKVYHDKSRNDHKKPSTHSGHDGRRRHHHRGSTTTAPTTTSITTPKRPIFRLINTSGNSQKSAKRKLNPPGNSSRNLFTNATTIVLSVVTVSVTWMSRFR